MDSSLGPDEISAHGYLYKENPYNTDTSPLSNTDTLLHPFGVRIREVQLNCIDLMGCWLITGIQVRLTLGKGRSGYEITAQSWELVGTEGMKEMKFTQNTKR